MCTIPKVGFYKKHWCNSIYLFIAIFRAATVPPSTPIASIKAYTAGDSAASSRTRGGGRCVITGGCRGRHPPLARLPLRQRDPRFEQNNGSWVAMAAATAPPTVPLHTAATAAPPAVPPPVASYQKEGSFQFGTFKKCAIKKESGCKCA